MNWTRGIRGRAGYTLSELMVVVALIGIMATIGLRGFAGYVKRERIEGSRNQLIADIYYARSLAISRSRTFAMQFQETSYRIVDTADGSVVRSISAPRGVTFNADANPNFYAWGLADAASVTLTDSDGTRTVGVLPTGSVDHGY